MNSLTKALILIVIIFGLSLVYSSYRSTVVSNAPSEFYGENVFSGFLKEEISNYPSNSKIEVRSRCCHKISRAIARLKEERLIGADDACAKAKSLYDKYVPQFLDFCQELFGQEDWDEKHLSGERLAKLFVDEELDFLTADGERHGIGVQDYDNWRHVYSVIEAYGNAYVLFTTKTDYEGVEETQSRLAEAGKYKGMKELKVCSTLVQGLEGLKNKICASHQNRIQAMKRSFPSGYTYNDYVGCVQQIKSVESELTDFRNLWRLYYDPYSVGNKCRELRSDLWDHPREIYERMCSLLSYETARRNFSSHNDYTARYDEARRMYDSYGGDKRYLRRLPSHISAYYWYL